MFRNREDLIFKFGNITVEVLGDPHLGKRFQAGVPLTRRGEREKMQRADFYESIMDTKADIHVCMGDLFDNFIIDLNTLLTTASFYRSAAESHPRTSYFILMGNHDMSRDVEKYSSFLVFKELVNDVMNIHVVDQALSWSIGGQVFGFFPYHPFKTSVEVMSEFIEEYDPSSDKFSAIFGHWDLDSFGEMPHNIFPHELALQITDQAFTGHIHLPDIREYGNLELVVVGSMQPYNHSEDPEHKLYVSLTLDMLKAADPATLKNKCVRLLLGQNEEAPEGLDALQYITKNLDAPDEGDDLEVVMEDFDFRQIIVNEMGLQGVDNQLVASAVMQEFDRLRAEENQ